MNDTLTMTRRPRRIRRSEATAVAVAAILFALLVLLASPLLATVSTVPQVDVDNRTQWPLQVAVRADGGGWMPLGIASARSGTTFTEVPDAGARWQVRYSYGGVELVDAVRRSDVRSAGWTLTVPQELLDALEGVGAPPAPPRGS